MGNVTTYKIPNGTKEEIRQSLMKQNFKFDPSAFYDYEAKNFSLVKNRVCGYMHDDFEYILNYIVYEMTKYERKTNIMPRLENLVQLGFAEDIDYSNFTNNELKVKLNLAKEKQQKFIKHILSLEKAKEDNISTEEGSLL